DERCQEIGVGLDRRPLEGGGLAVEGLLERILAGARAAAHGPRSAGVDTAPGGPWPPCGRPIVDAGLPHAGVDTALGGPWPPCGRPIVDAGWSPSAAARRRSSRGTSPPGCTASSVTPSTAIAPARARSSAAVPQKANRATLAGVTRARSSGSST